MDHDLTDPNKYSSKNKLRALILDFGFATIYEPGAKGNTFWGTPSYMAPELIKKNEFDYEKVDVWALGIVLYAILVGHFPFKGKNNREMYCKIIKGQFD